MGSLGTQEMILIFILALLVFGPKKLPELGRTVARAMGEFRRASTELRSTFEREMNSLERDNGSMKELNELRDVTREFQNEVTNYDDTSYYDYGESTPQLSESTATSSSTVSASAPQGAEQTTVVETPAEPAAPAATETPLVVKAAEGTVSQNSVAS
ncbi:MAG: twin-arginine translocase TatA/TatE family subunit [Acidobacteriaceae bacterium]|jgi:sec-independent protein translocase protein TatA|nr:twin-arginine translocase TatA/TatE family subunit [Acidobacteriaceae bacterium]